MMTYIVIGICIAFLCDLLLNNVNLKAIKNIKKTWGIKERIILILIWPIVILVFLYHFLKKLF